VRSGDEGADLARRRPLSERESPRLGQPATHLVGLVGCDAERHPDPAGEAALDAELATPRQPDARGLGDPGELVAAGLGQLAPEVEPARVAETAGVRLARGGQFGVEGGFARWVRVPFCVAPDEADEVGRRLASAWQLALGERPTTREVTPLIA